MKIISQQISEVKIIVPDLFADFRGYISVPFDVTTATALDFHIVQINCGYSKKPYTLRGLHYQEAPLAQAKLVACLHGSIYNVAVDIRNGSSTFGQYVAEKQSADNQKLMYIPRGFAHGYLTLESNTLVQWCVDNDFCQEAGRCIRWDSCGIEWLGKAEEYIISDKDKKGVDIKELI